MEAGTIGFCIAISQLALFIVREATWKAKLFGENLTRPILKHWLWESVRNWLDVKESFLTKKTEKLEIVLWGKAAIFLYLFWVLDYLGYTQFYLEVEGSREEEVDPFSAQIPWLEHGSSKETIYHKWNANKTRLADTVCATGNCHC